MYLKRIFSTLAILLLSFASIAQQKGAVIVGVVVEDKVKAPLEFATVQLLSAQDSTVQKSTTTDKKGRFTLDNIGNGNYILLCTFIGYQKSVTPLTLYNQQRINAGTVVISSLSTNLNEVKVTSKRSLLNTSIDRKIYNVGQDLMAQSGSAADVLKNVPSVEVDIDGGVSLRGSTEVMILINGKPSPLMGKSRAEVLQQLPSNTIERIEVITNPSARFRPDGTAGIINIVMKKNAKGGWNGTVVGNVGNNNRYNGSANLNYKTGKVNAFGTYSIRKDSRRRVNTTDRQELDGLGGTTLFYSGQNLSPAKPFSHIASAGMEYKINEQNSVGISANFSHRDQIKNDITNNIYFNSNHVVTQQYDRLRYDPEYEIEKDATVFWQHNFAKEDHDLRVEYNKAVSDEQEDNHFTNKYYVPATSPSFDNTLITQRSKEHHITVDYSNPISENAKLELGYDGSFSNQNPVFYGEYFDPARQKFIPDVVKSNKFIYYQSLNAIY